MFYRTARNVCAYLLAGLALSGFTSPTSDVSVGLADEPLAIAVPAAEAPASAPVDEPAFEKVGEGSASYYGHELAGNRTANGERFNPGALTAAHRTLPFGTKLRVTNKRNGKSVVVRVNDRGPFVKGRLIDVSLAAAREINLVSMGHAPVLLERLR